MTFEILWDPKAVSQLRKLPSDVFSRIVKKIRLVGETDFELEGLNSIVQSLKRSARGYRNPKNFMIMIYLRLGKLEFNLPT